MSTSTHVDATFRALSDATRREVVARLSRGPASVGELAGAHDMALPSFMKHLAVLEECGVVRSKKQGRVRTYQLKPKALRTAESWLGQQRTVWDLQQLKSTAEE